MVFNMVMNICVIDSRFHFVSQGVSGNNPKKLVSDIYEIIRKLLVLN